jgi:hypothetical protein
MLAACEHIAAGKADFEMLTAVPAYLQQELACDVAREFGVCYREVETLYGRC